MPKLEFYRVTLVILVSTFFLTYTMIFAGWFGFDLYAQTGDITPPVTEATLTPDTPDGNNDWYVSPVQIDLVASDIESGVAGIYYRIDGGSWNTASFSDTTNLAPNPSFETAAGNTSGLDRWEASVLDPEGTNSQDSTSAPAFPNNSARVDATAGSWHGLNNQFNYIPAAALDNMNASVWMKSQNVTGSGYFKVYAVLPIAGGGFSYQLITSSASITGSTGWTKITTSFTTPVDTIGVYLDIGLEGPGSIWADGVEVNTSINSTKVNFTIASDSSAHIVEYYAIDQDGNAEAHSCVTPKVNCIEFKLDQTPPGNWNGSGAVRGLGGGSNADHEVFVFTNVEDATSGLSTNSDIYQYHTSFETGFGYFEDLMACNSTWNLDGWTNLLETVLNDGDKTAFLQTPKTDVCDSNWKVCKEIRFYAEDMAGNSKTKDICLNGPWIKVRGGGIVRSNSYIDMVSESNEENTDGLIEVGGTSIDFFTSTENWRVTQHPGPSHLNYQDLYDMSSGTKTDVTGADLIDATGLYETTTDYEIDNQALPNSFNTTDFDQILYVDGNLTISTNIDITDNSTFLVVVSGDVFIDEAVDELDVAIITDGILHTAYDLEEGKTTKTLNMYGIYVAEQISFERTLQGTQNNDTPSENIIFEPKYVVQLKEFYSPNSIIWTDLE
jgi:hypothetical protein